MTNCVRKYLSSGAGPLGFVREAVVLHDLGAADVGDADDEGLELPHLLDDAEVEGEETEGDERDREQGDFEVRVHDEGGAEELDVPALGVVEGRELVRGCGHGVLGVGGRARTAGGRSFRASDDSAGADVRREAPDSGERSSCDADRFLGRVRRQALAGRFDVPTAGAKSWRTRVDRQADHPHLRSLHKIRDCCCEGLSGCGLLPQKNRSLAGTRSRTCRPAQSHKTRQRGVGFRPMFRASIDERWGPKKDLIFRTNPTGRSLLHRGDRRDRATSAQ